MNIPKKFISNLKMLNMEKYHHVLQPPLADKYSFLVDEISANMTYGSTIDIQKINYNRELLGDSFNVEVKISLLMTEEDIHPFVFAIGYYIVVLELKTDQKTGRMTFYHCMPTISGIELYSSLSLRYDEIIAKRWIDVCNYILSDLDPIKDNVQLLIPTELY